MSKDLSHLSTEELMQIAKIKVKEDENHDLPPAKRFIVSANIKSGNYKVPTTIVYQRYTEWCREYNLEVLSKIAFFREFDLYFRRSRLNGGKGQAYTLDCEGFAISDIYKIAPIKRTRKSKNVSTKEDKTS
jgi:hypothetical protein